MSIPEKAGNEKARFGKKVSAAVSTAIAAAAKKVLAVLAGNKDGRKFLSYVIGIAIFLVLLPVIALYGLFGWMSGNAAELIDRNLIVSQLPEYSQLTEQYQPELDQIETIFTASGLSESDISQARILYLSCLTGKESEDGFYTKLADCFLNRSGENDLLTNISSAFGVTFTETERQQFYQLYT